MKNIILIFCTITFLQFNAHTQSDRYTESMREIVAQLDTTEASDDLREIANKLERVANAESTEWLPNYYLSYIDMKLALAAMRVENMIALETSVGEAEKHHKLALDIAGENSELVALQGYIYQAYLWVNPMKNGQKYSGLAHGAFAKAAAMDPQNPRPLMLRGMMVLHTPKFFGGGAEHALPLLQGANALYEQEQQTDKGIEPHWGAGTAAYMLGKAEEEME